MTAFAAKLGVNPSTVHDIKTGRRKPSLGLARKIEKETDGAVGLGDYKVEGE